MPYTVNGIGTTYYGKKHLERYHGVCESCRREVLLEDYQTGYFFCLIFIPIIPLGKKQIIGYCPVCTQHRAMAVAEWERIKESSINDSMSTLAQNKDDPHAAMDLLGTLTGFKQYEPAVDLAKAMQNSFQDNVEVQLFLGAWYEQRQDPAAANVCFEQAFRLDPDHPGAIRAEGVGLIERGKLDDASELFRKLEPPSEHYDPAIFFLLAQAREQQREFPQAMELYQLIQKHSPDWAKDKSFKKAMKKLQKQM